MDKYDLYKDIQTRTRGEIYIGVVGPVRTGKSTFIKRFMDMMVLPAIEDVHSREQARDELPQSSAGTIIMTSEPKFIPKEAVEIAADKDIRAKIRLIDCVGFMVQGASGHEENGKERMVMTPWFDEPMPFTKAADIGTRKVIKDHSTIGLVVTTDGTIGEIPRENYVEGEERAVAELKKIGKPFILLLNSARPYSEEAKALAGRLEEKYQIRCLPINCDQLKKSDVEAIMTSLLYEFPVTSIEYFLPGWMDILPKDHELKRQAIETLKELTISVRTMRQFRLREDILKAPWIKKHYVDDMDLSTGRIVLHIEMDERHYHHILSDILGVPINGEYAFFSILKDLAERKDFYEKTAQAMGSVMATGYGMVMPAREEVRFEAPQIIRHGSQYGVNIKASAPSIHMILATVETEIAPIVGSEEQAEDLIRYIKAHAQAEDGDLWDTLILGKSIGQLVEDGIQNKVARMTAESQVKMQETLQKIINDSNGGVVFVII